jgi:hypothetical protein
MPQHYASTDAARLIGLANRDLDRGTTTILRLDTAASGRSFSRGDLAERG